MDKWKEISYMITIILFFALITFLIIYNQNEATCPESEIVEVEVGCPISCPVTKVCDLTTLAEHCIEYLQNADTIRGVSVNND